MTLFAANYVTLQPSIHLSRRELYFYSTNTSYLALLFPREIWICFISYQSDCYSESKSLFAQHSFLILRFYF